MNAPVPFTVAVTSTGVAHVLTLNQHDVARIRDTWDRGGMVAAPVNRQHLALLFPDGSRCTVVRETGLTLPSA